MNLYWRELKSTRKSLVIWSIGILLMVVSGMAKFGTVETTGMSMNALVEDLPKSMKVIMGIGDFDITTAIGYYGVLYLYLLSMCAIHAVLLGASIISKEERDHTAEFLFTKPISKVEVVTTKMLAALTQVLLLNCVSFLSSILAVNHYNVGPSVLRKLLLFTIGMALVQLVFLFVGSSIAALMRTQKKTAAVATAVLLSTFLLSILINLSDGLSYLSYLSPFQYFQAKDILSGVSLSFPYVLISLLVVGTLSVVTVILFNKRDLDL